MDAKIQFLRATGHAEMEHDSHVPFLSHLAGTRRILQRWGAREALCDAALFHSVYGTEFFEIKTIPLRSRIQELIGSDAEEVAWLWCAIERTSLDPSTGTVVLRRDGSSMTISMSRIEDLATLWAADTVEQLARMEPHERGFAHGVRRLSAQMMPRARTELEGVLASGSGDRQPT